MVDSPGSRHISGRFDEELDDVRARLMEMGGLVEEQLRNACRSLIAHDKKQADAVRRGDAAVNALELELDDRCIHIIARRQPAASDLRLLVCIMKASTDLERIGDEANRIAKSTQAVADLPLPEDQYADVRGLAAQVVSMLNESLNAMAMLDAAAAAAIIGEDEQIDADYKSTVARLVGHMQRDPDVIPMNIHRLWAARALERIGDHAKNICEYVIYCVEGEDVRYGGSDAHPH